MKSVESLQAVRNIANGTRDQYARIRAEAEEWVTKQREAADAVLERAVVAALEDGHTVTAVAEYFTISGATPNRGAIHKIKRKMRTIGADLSPVDDYPFEWKPRVVKSRAGERTVYDLVTSMFGFGPSGVTGVFTFRYDNGELDPVLTDADPYPYEQPYYREVIDRWLDKNPYPGGE